MTDLISRVTEIADDLDTLVDDEMIATLREAAAALEAAREDGERYRALRDALLDDESEAWEAFTQQPEPKNAADFDAAIDQARGKGGAGK